MWSAACAATSGGGRTLFIDHGTTPENPQLDTNTTGDDLAYGFAGRRVLGQRLVTHTLCYLEAPRLVARIAGNGLVGIGWHYSISVLQWRRPVGRVSADGLIMAEI